MRLRVMLPERVEADVEVERVSADATIGSYTLLPRHVDCVLSLSAGLLSYQDREGAETFLAVDEGLLVKCGRDVMVSTSRAVRGELGELEQAIEQSFRRLDDREQRARTALKKMQVSFLRRFSEWEGRG
jgi:F-type H+-transporting ATPase subunit epsilon